MDATETWRRERGERYAQRSAAGSAHCLDVPHGVVESSPECGIVAASHGAAINASVATPGAGHNGPGMTTLGTGGIGAIHSLGWCSRSESCNAVSHLGVSRGRQVRMDYRMVVPAVPRLVPALDATVAAGT